MEEKDPHKKKKEPGQYIGMGIALGSGIGVTFGTALGNIALGLPIGMAVGLLIGAALERQARERGEIREMTEDEKNCSKRKVWIAFFGGFAVAFAATVLYFAVSK